MYYMELYPRAEVYKKRTEECNSMLGCPPPSPPNSLLLPSSPLNIREVLRYKILCNGILIIILVLLNHLLPLFLFHSKN